MDVAKSRTTTVKTAVSDLLALTKVRLSVSVVFSSVAGFLLGVDTFELSEFILLIIGGCLVVGASNAFNQVIERDLDARMRRTWDRPLPDGRMQVWTALTIAGVFALSGLMALYALHPKAALFGAISLFLYVSAYTPLKTRTPLSVLVGAFPGAIPFMLGWVAATGKFGIEAGTLFMIQFFWQFPHFWAIGWLAYEDYSKAGFKMLPTGKRDRSTALQTVLYTLWTVLASLIPVFGLTGKFYITHVSAVLVGAIGLWFLYTAWQLYRKRTTEAAKKLMLVSVSYITLLQIIYVLDKFIR